MKRMAGAVRKKTRRKGAKVRGFATPIDPLGDPLVRKKAFVKAVARKIDSRIEALGNQKITGNSPKEAIAMELRLARIHLRKQILLGALEENSPIQPWAGKELAGDADSMRLDPIKYSGDKVNTRGRLEAYVAGLKEALASRDVHGHGIQDSLSDTLRMGAQGVQSDEDEADVDEDEAPKPKKKRTRKKKTS